MNDIQNLTIKETFDLAVQNHQNNKLNVAHDLYNQVLKIDPGNVSTLNNLGIIFKKLGEYQKAKGCYEKAIAINPNYADAHNNLGGVFKELREYQKAKECFEKALEIDPLNKLYMTTYGDTLIFLNDKFKGFDYIKKGQGVIKFTPSYSKII